MIKRSFQQGAIPLFVIGILALVGLGGGAVVASENSLPGDSLYAVKQAKEGIQLNLVRLPEAQARIQAGLATKRLEEAVALAGEEQRTQHFEQAILRYQEHLAAAQLKAEEAKSQGKDVEEILTILAENTLRHLETLESVYERVPDEAKPGIERAMFASQRGYEEATKAVSGEKAQEIFEQTETRMESVREKLQERGLERFLPAPSEFAPQDIRN